MSPHRRSIALTIGVYAAVGLLAVNLAVMLSRDRTPDFSPAAFAQHQGQIAGGAGVYVMPAQIADNLWGCYLLDVDAGTLCVYQYFKGARQLQLLAARDYKWDRRLKNFNTSPDPEEIRQLIEKQNAAKPPAN